MVKQHLGAHLFVTGRNCGNVGKAALGKDRDKNGFVCAKHLLSGLVQSRGICGDLAGVEWRIERVAVTLQYRVEDLLEVA